MPNALHSAQIALLNEQVRLPVIAQVAMHIAVVVTKWDRYHKTRRQLKTLPPHLLDDVGLTRSDAKKETAKQFWQD